MSDRSSQQDRTFRDAMGDLDTLLDGIWTQLPAAVASSKHGWHLPMIATGGQQPHVRTVVLRDAARQSNDGDGGPIVACHTDARSPKVTQLRLTPHASWCFYDRENRVQLVADGPTQVHTDDAVAEAGWDRSSLSSRRCYLAPAAPGDPLDAARPNLPEHLVGQLPSEEEVAVGRENFAVLQTRVQRLDFLFLAFDGNLRAEFTLQPDGSFDGQWIAA